jgi:hypothetical protein
MCFVFMPFGVNGIVQGNAVGAMVRTGGGTFVDILLPVCLYTLTILVAVN